ncbi:MAG: hypothetical protein ACLP5H_20165 [Desulfomonilaceae bacterium]
MGQMYLLGDGVSQDVGEVIKWHRKAARNGEQEAEKALARIEKVPQGPGTDPKLQRVARLLLLFPRGEALGPEKFWTWLGKGIQPSKKDANTFLLACILDYQMRAHTVWENTRRFTEDVLHDPDDLWGVITKHSEAEWKSKFREYKLHRFPKAHERVWHIGKDVVTHYEGDARKIWEGQTPAIVHERLMKLGKHGVGLNIANMIVGALLDTDQIDGTGDLKADTHVRRVLGRVLLGREFKADESSEAVKMARKVYPVNPWLLDQPMYFHGQSVCLKSDPKCKTCYLRAECAFFKRA